ncbi:class I SAM-dependent methyltransferase [bacterium]|jgi:SAM-dependent methyltransferase|nr:class I SAM-dependent methyltransferase [bacterium]
MQKAILLLIDYPKNWLGQTSQFLSALDERHTSSISLVLKRILDTQLPILANVWINQELNEEELSDLQALEEMLESCAVPTVFTDKTEGAGLETNRLNATFKSYPKLQSILKVRPEDFLSPSNEAIGALLENLDEDYIFSINEPVGLNFEIFSRKCLEKLIEFEASEIRPQMAICRDFVDSFSRKRLHGGYVDESKPHYRFTLDSEQAANNLKSYLHGGGILEKAPLMDWSRQQKCFLRFFDEPFYNHRSHFDRDEFSNQYIIQFFERGLFGKRYMKRNCRVLDLCCGSMFLAEFFYSTGTSNILCVDDCQDAEDLYSALELKTKGINFLRGSILSEEDWKKMADRGPFDVVTWTAAIEHFSLEHQHWILKKISQVLDEGGVLLGDTVVFSPEGLPGHWQHKNEIVSQDDMNSVLAPHFSNVDTFITYYEEMTFQPIYFVGHK